MSHDDITNDTVFSVVGSPERSAGHKNAMAETTLVKLMWLCASLSNHWNQSSTIFEIPQSTLLEVQFHTFKSKLGVSVSD